MWLYERCAPTFPEYQLTGAGAGPVSGAAGQGWTLSGCGGNGGIQREQEQHQDIFILISIRLNMEKVDKKNAYIKV